MEFFQRLLNQFRTLWTGLSAPRRVAIVALAVLGLLAVAAISYLSYSTEYRVAYTNLTAEESGGIIAKLDAQGIPYRLEAGGSTILLPVDRRDRIRLDLAREGLPTKGGKGYEIFDEAPIGTTPFVQQIKALEALQNEVAKSLMSLEPVASARVMIARSDPTPFLKEKKETTASVVINLKRNVTLNRSMISGMIALVAAGVEGLKPENVKLVVDGRLVTDPRLQETDGLGNAQLEYRRELETYLASKAEEMLTRNLGPLRAIVKVSADINFQKVKEKSETVSPENKAIIAERTSTSTNTPGAARGPVGAVSNISRPGGATGAGGGGSSKEEKNETDYIVSKTTRELEDRLGNVKRLTIATMVDLSPDPSGKAPMSIADVQEIVKQAIGYQQGRDEIKVSDVRLTPPEPAPEPTEEAGRFQRVQAYVGLARNVALTVALVVTVGLAVLLLVRRRQPSGPTAAQKATEQERIRQQRERFEELARKEPEKVAGIIAVMAGAPAQ